MSDGFTKSYNEITAYVEIRVHNQFEESDQFWMGCIVFAADREEEEEEGDAKAFR